MLKVTDGIFVGNSYDEMKAQVASVLNVAYDLVPTRQWPTVEYTHIGLIDGPGNPLSRYCAAVLALDSMTRPTLVCCHEGKSRSVAVVLMYMHFMRRLHWESAQLMINEQNDFDVPEPNAAHKVAYNSIDWPMLKEAHAQEP